MNYGVRTEEWFEPSWHVQYFDNRVCEGQTTVGSHGDGRKSERYAGPLTRWAVHRRQDLAADNSGGISIGGDIRLWIDRGVQEPVELAEALRPVPADAMRVYAVCPWGNDARHDDARRLKPAA